MKEPRNVPQTRGYRLTPTAVRTIQEERSPQHFFYSEKLGKCRAIIISDAENLPRPTASEPRSKGDILKVFMDCAERLHKRFLVHFKAYAALPENDYKGKNKAFTKVERVGMAQSRVLAKITELLNGKEAALLPSPTLCLPKLKNSELKKLQAQYEAKWQSFWDSDLELEDTDYSEMSEMLSCINDEIERRQARGQL